LIVLEGLIWLLIGLPLYSMIVYPILMLILSRFFTRRFQRDPITPMVSMIICAYNEEESIAAKLENTLALDYPKDRLEIIVASDGSTDRTDDIVRGFAGRGVTLLRFDGGMGKTAVLNATVPHARGEILVFSDATGMWDPEAVARMVEHFADPRIGCVSGRVGYTYGEGVASRGFRIYQEYVLALRRAEAAFGTGFNASGSIHAVRATLFRPGPPDTFMDMVDPLHTVMQGHNTSFEENAVSMESTRTRTSQEFHARLRIALRAWRFITYALPRLPFLRAPMYCFQVISHKFLRWCIGPSLALILLLNLLLLWEGPIYRWLFAAQATYYLLTGLALLLGKFGRTVPLLSGLVFFNSANLAYVVSLFRFLQGRRISQWVPPR
jgi:cellulose synthase/poly-beta-1,6-N-acetylglucosamine synthase-like glycosyltransferase